MDSYWSGKWGYRRKGLSQRGPSAGASPNQGPNKLTYPSEYVNDSLKAHTKPKNTSFLCSSSRGNLINNVESNTFNIPLHIKSTALEESSNQEGSDFSTKQEDFLISLFLSMKYNFNLNPKRISDYVHFNIWPRNDAIMYIKNYFCKLQCKTLNDVILYVNNYFCELKCQILNKKYNFNLNPYNMT